MFFYVVVTILIFQIKDQFSCTQGTIDSVCSVKWNRVHLCFLVQKHFGFKN